jgi:hypothetical protein
MTYVVLILAWYIIGVLGMLTLQYILDGIDEKTAVGSQEIWVLGLFGPVIFLAIGLDFLFLLWMSRK